MSILPPSGIASRALIARLRIASSSWLASIRAGGRPCGNIEPQLHTRPERAFEQIDHAFDQRAQIDRHRAQILLAGEGQQPLGQRGAAFGALDGAVDQPLQARIVRQALAQQIEIAHHGHQQIVEIVRDAAGELADGLHLLGLAQLLLRLLASGRPP